MLIHGKPEHSDGFSAFHFVSFDELVFRLQTPCAYCHALSSCFVFKPCQMLIG